MSTSSGGPALSRGARQALLWLTLLLVLFPLAISKPGLPGSLKSDEPAYYLMALSLVHDGDLRFEPRDAERLFVEFPYFPSNNTILMTPDGWRTVYYGKPYVYSFFAAPMAGLFGANGIVGFNMLLLMAMVAMGASYLRRFNSDALAVGWSAGFFILSSTFAYVFWMHPELFNMAGVMAALYFGFHPGSDAPGRWRWLRGAAARAWLSGICLAPAVYNKPMLALFALPLLWIFLRRSGWRGVVRWCAGALVAGGVVVAISWALTGTGSAYLGVFRKAWNIHSPDFMPPVLEEQIAERKGDQGSWWWIISPPISRWGDFVDNLPGFLVGRHTGLFVYMPFSLLSLLMFLFHQRRSRSRWLLAASLAGVALVFLLWIPFNWHGGGGFVGNRYFVNAYPGFLFLAARLAPAWLTAVGYAAGGLLLGGILFTPYGAPVHRPTLQAHVRHKPFSLFPFEFGIRDKIPGYWGASQLGAWFYGRRDVFEVNGEELWFHGRTATSIWMFTAEPLEEAVFRVRSAAAGNRVRVRLPGDEVVVETGDPPVPKTITVRPTHPTRVRRERVRPPRGGRLKAFIEWPFKTFYIYELEVDSRGGEPSLADALDQSEFFLGAALTYLGDPASIDVDLWGVEWLDCSFPERVELSEEPFLGTVRLRNTSTELWPSGPPDGRLKLAYHWLDENGETVVFDGRRSKIGRDVAAGEEIEVVQQVWTPDTAGRYTLEVDLVWEFVGWFSRRGQPTCAAEIEVLPAGALPPD